MAGESMVRSTVRGATDVSATTSAPVRARAVERSRAGPGTSGTSSARTAAHAAGTMRWSNAEPFGDAGGVGRPPKGEKPSGGRGAARGPRRAGVSFGPDGPGGWSCAAGGRVLDFAPYPE